MNNLFRSNPFNNDFNMNNSNNLMDMITLQNLVNCNKNQNMTCCNPPCNPPCNNCVTNTCVNTNDSTFINGDLQSLLDTSITDHKLQNNNYTIQDPINELEELQGLLDDTLEKAELEYNEKNDKLIDIQSKIKDTNIFIENIYKETQNKLNELNKNIENINNINKKQINDENNYVYNKDEIIQLLFDQYNGSIKINDNYKEIIYQIYKDDNIEITKKEYENLLKNKHNIDLENNKELYLNFLESFNEFRANFKNNKNIETYLTKNYITKYGNTYNLSGKTYSNNYPYLILLSITPIDIWEFLDDIIIQNKDEKMFFVDLLLNSEIINNDILLLRILPDKYRYFFKLCKNILMRDFKDILNILIIQSVNVNEKNIENISFNTYYDILKDSHLIKYFNFVEIYTNILHISIGSKFTYPYNYFIVFELFIIYKLYEKISSDKIDTINTESSEFSNITELSENNKFMELTDDDKNNYYEYILEYYNYLFL